MIKLQEETLEPISNERVWKRYIRYIEELQLTVFCKVSEREIYFEALAEKVDETGKIYLNKISNDPSQKKLLAGVNGTTKKQVNLRYLLENILIFANTKVLSISDQNIILAVQPPIYKLQKRAGLRVLCTKEMKCTVQLTSPTSSVFPCFDISLAGFSVLIPTSQGEKHWEGKCLSDVKFSLEGMKALLEAKVAFKGEVTVEKGKKKVKMCKLGFSVFDFPAKLERNIYKIANEAGRNFLRARLRD